MITQTVIDVTILSLIAAASAHIVVKETSVSVPSLMQQLEVKFGHCICFDKL